MSSFILVFLPLFRTFLPFRYRCLLKVPLVLSFQGKNEKTLFISLSNRNLTLQSIKKLLTKTWQCLLFKSLL